MSAQEYQWRFILTEEALSDPGGYSRMLEGLGVAPGDSDDARRFTEFQLKVLRRIIDVTRDAYQVKHGGAKEGVSPRVVRVPLNPKIK